MAKFDDLRLERELRWMAEKKIEYIFVCDANFGIQKRDVEIAKSVAKIKGQTGSHKGSRCRTPKMPPNELI